MEDYRFQVNLGGMIEILSDHLYSSPDVYIRELLQNAVDAITGRKKAEPSHEGQILITVEENKGRTMRCCARQAQRSFCARKREWKTSLSHTS